MTWWCRLAALFVVVAAVVYPQRASAATAVQLETRVRGIELVVHALVGGSSSPSPEKDRGSGAAYDEIAPGYSLAAEETGALAGSIRNVNVLGGTQNCVGCAIAADATLGGSPASAVGGGPFPVVDILKNYPGGSFIPANGYGGIQTVLSGWGPGARGIVWGTRAGGLPGHVFNVVNQGGVIRFLDAQSGGAAVLQDFDALFLLRTN